MERFGEVLPALCLHPLHLQIGGFLAQLRLGGVKRHLKIEGIDDVEHVAFVNVLVVDDPDFGDLPRYLRRDVRDLHPNAAVPRPGRGDIVVPDERGREQGYSEDEQGRRRPEHGPSETSHATRAFRQRLFERRHWLDAWTLARMRSPFQDGASPFALR